MWETIETTWSYLTTRQKVVFGLLTAAQLFANVLDLVGIAAGVQAKLYLGNLDAIRDWG